MPIVFYLDVVPWEISSIHVDMFTDVTMILVLFMQPFLGETFTADVHQIFLKKAQDCQFVAWGSTEENRLKGRAGAEMEEIIF